MSMNAGQPLREGEVQSKASQDAEAAPQVLRQQTQKQGPDQITTRNGQGTWQRESVRLALEKALDALFKAQDHLNTAVDQGDDGLSKMIGPINQSLRGLQREVAQVTYRLGNGG